MVMMMCILSLINIYTGIIAIKEYFTTSHLIGSSPTIISSSTTITSTTTTTSDIKIITNSNNNDNMMYYRLWGDWSIITSLDVIFYLAVVAFTCMVAVPVDPTITPSMVTLCRVVNGDQTWRLSGSRVSGTFE
jgi:hypothetical protein